MTGLHRRLVLLAALLWVPTVVAAAAPNAFNASYLPELQRLQQQQDWAGLERLSRQALTSSETAGGPDSTDVAKAAGWLAIALQEQGRGAEAEPLFRRALAINQKVLGPEHAATGLSMANLAHGLQQQGRYAESETLYRQALTIHEKAHGPDGPTTVAIVMGLAETLHGEGHYAEAEAMLRRAVSSREKTLGPEHPDTAAALYSLAAALLSEGSYEEAEAAGRRALAIDEKALGPDSAATAQAANNLAVLLRVLGRYEEAEPLMRRALSIEEKLQGPDSPITASCVSNLAELLRSEGRYAEAELLFRRALAIDEKSLPAGVPVSIHIVGSLASLLLAQGRTQEAEPLLRRALTASEGALGPDHPDTINVVNSLAQVLLTLGRYREAEPLLQRALAVDEKVLGAEHATTAANISGLAEVLLQQRRYSEADPLYRRALAIDEKVLGPQHPTTAESHQALGLNDLLQSKFDDATLNYRLACSVLSARRAHEQSGAGVQTASSEASSCWTWLSFALWYWAAKGGGPAAMDQPEALKLEAFAATQRALQSAAGDAMAHSAAQTAARSSSVGPQAQAYEAALLERDSLDQEFASAAAASGQAGVDRRQTLARSRDEVIARIDRLAAQLKSQAPLYWDYRAPEAVSVAALQATRGADAALLHDDEALIMFLVPQDARLGKSQGLVFALSKQRLAWAYLKMTTVELKARVLKLRSQIDPESYGLRAIKVVPAAPASDAAAPAQTSTGSGPGGFDRQAAYQLYQALIGDPSIQAVISDKPVLLFVPSGALTSLPPALLVTAPPADGPEHDSDPASLRATAWLLRSKAVAVLPAVSSLRTLRQILPAARASTSDPLLAFADPDFSRPATASQTRATAAALRGFSSYFRDGAPLAQALDDVPRLPGTRIEGEALERALHGRPGSLLTGRDASKAELMSRNADGRLAQVRVLEFATHGLVAGDASDLAEPALLLAAGATPADELLLASEAATLRLNADWVLLSACNTASPDAPEAQGVSGLSRSFFYAGARSLLVSHWRVRDDIAPLLIPAMLLAERQHPHLSHAEALRQASLAILDDRSLDAASPAAWAPFALIGEAAR